jgi:Xaa-Pro aminopeptidase
MDVLIFGDTGRTPELRHEVPIAIMDPFVYAEVDGRRIVAIASMEASRVEALGTGLEVRTFEEFGHEELRRSGLDVYTVANELTRNIARDLGVSNASVPRAFPLGVANALQGDGISLTVDQKLFDERRRRKSEYELAGIRRAQKASQAAMAAALDLLRRSEPRNGSRSVDGQQLTCELLRERIQSVLIGHEALATEIIVSHGSQTAVGHDEGSGPIGANDIVLIDLFPVDVDSACYADMTRTFALGQVDDELHAWHDLCREALELAVADVRPGANSGDIHRHVCALFAEHGHPTQVTKQEEEVLRDGFYHALGHGVGLEAHEAPYVGMIGEELVAGDVLALEPGLYRHGFAGIRLEDLLLVTDDGCEVLTEFPYDFEVTGDRRPSSSAGEAQGG